MSSWHPCANVIKSWWRAPIKSKKFCAMGQKKRGALLRLSWQKYAPQLVCAQQPWRTYPPPAIQHSKTVRKRHAGRSEEHTSELQSRGHLVCRLLLETKKKMDH